MTKDSDWRKSKSTKIALVALLSLFLYFACAPLFAAYLENKPERYLEERPYLSTLFKPAGFVYLRFEPYRMYCDYWLR